MKDLKIEDSGQVFYKGIEVDLSCVNIMNLIAQGIIRESLEKEVVESIREIKLDILLLDRQFLIYKEQKQKYLQKLASGEWKGCYCLTEPGAGSDANSGKTKTVLSDDGILRFWNNHLFPKNENAILQQCCVTGQESEIINVAKIWQQLMDSFETRGFSLNQ